MEPFSEFNSYIDQKLKHYATKADLEVVRTEIARAEARIIRWMVGTGIALALLVIAALAIFVNIVINGVAD